MRNDENSTILNLILTKLHRIHRRIVVNACVYYQKQIFIGVGDIYLDRNFFKYFVNLSKQNSNKSAILNFILTKLYRIHKRIVLKACVEYQEEICIDVGVIHLASQIVQIICQFEQTKMAMSLPF